jgi:hypothetical protein
MGDYDHLIPKTADAAPATGGDYDHLIPSGGAYAAKELTREQEIKYSKLAELRKQEVPPLLDRAIDQYTMGLTRPLSGLNSVLEGKANEWFKGGKPATAGEYWRGGVGAQDEKIRAAEAETRGAAGTAADVAGALTGGSGGPKIIGKGAQVARAFLQGAIGGGSRNAEDIGSAAKGAAIGGTVDAVTTGALNTLFDRFTRGARKEIGVASRGGSGQQMKTDAGEIFETLKDAGIRYSPKETAPLAGNVAQRLAKEGFNPNMHSEVIPVLGEIGASGGGMTWNQLRNMQTQISDLKAHADPRLRRIAGELASEVDNFLNTAKPTMPAASVAAGVNPAKDVATAKDLYARGKQSGKLEGLAEVAAGAKDPAEATQSVFKRYSDTFTKNPDKFNPNTPEQRRLIDAIGTGDPKTAGLAKELSRWGDSLTRYGAAGTAAGVGLPVLFGGDPYNAGGITGGTGATLLAAGLLSKGGARGLRQMLAEKGAERVNDLLRNVATGQTAVQPGAYVPRDELAKILLKQNLAQGAGNYASSFTNVGEPQP